MLFNKTSQNVTFVWTFLIVIHYGIVSLFTAKSVNVEESRIMKNGSILRLINELPAKCVYKTKYEKKTVCFRKNCKEFQFSKLIKECDGVMYEKKR